MQDMEENKIVEGSLSLEIIKEKIHIIRGKKVMIDRDLAMLYGVPTKRLNEAVKRNLKRFPDDFMFLLDRVESAEVSRSQIATLKTEGDQDLKSQSVTSKQERDQGLRSQFATSKRGGTRVRPYCFTEQGIAMLSSVLNSDRAIAVNIQIIRIFTKLREMIDAYKELREKVEEMEKSSETNFREIFRVIRLIIKEEEKPKRQIGFTAGK